MNAALCAADIEGFRALITRKLGLFFDDGKLDFLADILRQRMERASCSHFAEYERRIAPMTLHDAEIRTLAEALTIGETYFFRYADQFEALARVALPGCIKAREQERTLRILSAGCSSGEEAYSVRDRDSEDVSRAGELECVDSRHRYQSGGDRKSNGRALLAVVAARNAR